MSLRTKLLLWNSGFFVFAILAFGLLQIAVSRQAAIAAIDRELRGRAFNVGRGPFGPPPGMAADPNRPRMGNDVRRPRVFELDGSPLNPAELDGAWDKDLIAKTKPGHAHFADIVHDGLALRVLSQHVMMPDHHPVIVQVAQETDSLRLAERSQVTAFLVVLPLAGGFAAVLGYLLSRLVTSPVRHLTKAAERIASELESKERTRVAGEDEMARLSAAFDLMTDRLQDSNASLKQSLEAQKRFTGDAAHELRTPLTSISLSAENALHPEATSDDKQRSLETVLRSAQIMQKLTNMLLTLSKLDAAKQNLELDAVPLLPVLKNAVVGAGLENDQRLLWDIVPEAPVVTASSDALLQIVTNLLENAAVYTPQDRTITLRFRERTLEVIDTGDGIAEEHLPHVFDRFYRADPSRSRSKGGHGLGLAICQALADAQGCRLKVASKVGSGTTFSLEFSGLNHDS